jgi:hypothetical protein
MLGRAKQIRTVALEAGCSDPYDKFSHLRKHFGSDYKHKYIDDLINEWLNGNPEADIIDIKYTSSQWGSFSDGDGSINEGYSALIIYKK